MDLYLPGAEVRVAWVALLLLGFGAGVVQGFFGVGGGWLTTPALDTFGIPIVYAIGTSLAYTAGSALVGAARHHRLGNLDVSLAAVLGVSGVAGVEAAKRLVLLLERHGLAEGAVRTVYIVLLLGVGLALLAESARGRWPARAPLAPLVGERDATPTPARCPWGWSLPPRVHLEKASVTISLWVLVLIGLGVGLLAGFLGTGGGFVMVPLLVYALGIPTRTAVASSLFCILLTNGYGAAAYGLAGRVEVLAAGLMWLGSFVGVQLGATATMHVRGARIRTLLGCTLIAAGLAVLLRQLGASSASAIVLFGAMGVVSALILGLLAAGAWRAARGVAGPRRPVAVEDSPPGG